MVSKVCWSRCGSGPDAGISDAFTPLLDAFTPLLNLLKMSAE